MPKISTEALIVSIQAVAAEIRALQEVVQAGELEAEEYLLLEERERAAESLRQPMTSLPRTD